MGLPLRDSAHHSYADYLAWRDDKRYELIDGKAYLIFPAPSLEHQNVVGEIYRQLANGLRGHACRAFVAPVDVRLPKTDAADSAIDTVVQPDVFVVCDREKFDRRGILGAPDFVVEVLSSATAGHDHLVKRQLYERVGVREYWLVHPTDRLLTRYLLDGDRYGAALMQELLGVTAVACLPGISVDWEEILPILPPPEV